MVSEAPRDTHSQMPGHEGKVRRTRGFLASGFPLIAAVRNAAKSVECADPVDRAAIMCESAPKFDPARQQYSDLI